jgi:hypothetical protein
MVQTVNTLDVLSMSTSSDATLRQQAGILVSSQGIIADSNFTTYSTANGLCYDKPSSATSGSFNWYLFSNTASAPAAMQIPAGTTLSSLASLGTKINVDFSYFNNGTSDSNPIFLNVYTKPTGTNDKQPGFYKSRVNFVANQVGSLLGTIINHQLNFDFSIFNDTQYISQLTVPNIMTYAAAPAVLNEEIQYIVLGCSSGDTPLSIHINSAVLTNNNIENQLLFSSATYRSIVPATMVHGELSISTSDNNTLGFLHNIESNITDDLTTALYLENQGQGIIQSAVITRIIGNNVYFDVTTNQCTSESLNALISSLSKLKLPSTTSYIISSTNAATVTIIGSLNSPPVFVSDVCFPAGTRVRTDQGVIRIEKLNPDIHTIRKKNIVAITKTLSNEKHLISIEKDSLFENVPSEKTIISQKHQIFYQGKMYPANHFVDDFKGVEKVKYHGETLYNVLLETHEKMIVNNMLVETLHPENKVAKLFRREYPEYNDDL